MKKILTVFGTRPECIKLAPVIHELNDQGIENAVCLTGQHREMIAPFVDFFRIQTDFDLSIMEARQDLYHITTKVLYGLRDVLREYQPTCVVIQGDTTTAFISSLAAFYEGIPIAHVEAGLRTYDKCNPYPEEINRRFVDSVSDWLFPPTIHARNNLLREGISEDRAVVTGNTVIDALQSILYGQHYQSLNPPTAENNRLHRLLLTAHRRENFGARLESICQAARDLVWKRDDIEIVYPVHLNPNVREPVQQILGNVERIKLIEPLSYLELLKLMESSTLILTDSGGIQEEAPALGKPVLVLRDKTERPEGIEAGVAKLVGTDTKRIIRSVVRHLGDQPEPQRAPMAGVNPYGDGKAAQRMVNQLTT